MRSNLFSLFSVTLIFIACQSNEPTTGISIEPNTTAENSSSSEGNSAAGNDESISKNAFIDSILHTYGPIHLNDESGDPSEHSSPATMYSLSNKRESYYYHSSKSGSCSVIFDKDDNAAQKVKTIKPGSNSSFQTVLLKNNDNSLFMVNLLYASYNDNDVCEVENKSYLEQIDVSEKQIKIINSGCNSTEIVYVKEMPSGTTLENIMAIWKQECEEYVASLTEPPTKPGETCQMDANGEIYCETTSR